MRIPEFQGDIEKQPMDQLATYEVFLVPKEGKPLESVGPVHASGIEMAFVFGKEGYSRRFTCVAMAVCATSSIYPSPVSDNGRSCYESLSIPAEESGEEQQFEIFHMTKRGKFHKHVGAVEAKGPNDALHKAAAEFKDETPLNAWVIPTSDFYFNTEEDSDLWATLPEKKYRDAIFYKAGDKIQKYKESENV